MVSVIRQLARGWPEGAVAGSIAALPATWIMTRLDKVEDDVQAAGLARRTATLLGERLDSNHVEMAIPIVRYTIGMALGAVYGSVVETIPVALVTAGLFGSAVWVLGVLLDADSRATVRGLAAHMMFGVMMEVTRRAVSPLV